MNDKAADAGRDSGEVDLRCEARSLAEHHVAVARTGAGVAGAIAALCPDDDVVEAVAVDVAGRGYRPPHLIELLLAMNDEAADSGGHIRKIDRHVLRSVSLAKLCEVTADGRAAPPSALPRLPPVSGSRPAPA